MAKVELNKAVPNFSLPATGEQTISLKSLKGQNLVLYFYPKDNTPGCTREGQDFRDGIAKFKRQNTVILGVSRDSLRSHENFKTKQKFKYEEVNFKCLCITESKFNRKRVISLVHMFLYL